MSNLVADFLINPVLRQARRFSGTTIDRIHSVTSQRTRDEVTSHDEDSVRELPEPMNTDLLVEDEGSVSGRPLVSSPIAEDGGLEAELVAIDRAQSAPGTIDPSSAVPLRLASYRSDRMSIDDDISDNPSYGIPSRFQNASPISSSFSSTTHNRRTSPTSASRSIEVATQPMTSGGVTRQRNSSLPEDDGMSSLRRKIVKIQKMNISSGEKARLMHQLLTEGYSQSQISLHAKMPPRTQSPTGMVNQERPTTPGSLSSFSFWQTTATDTPPESSPSSSVNTFHLSQADLKPTYAPVESRPHASSDSGDSDDSDAVQSLGCKHYRRNVKLQCFTCGGWYTCRFCHDELEDHVLNRKETRNMLCMLCGTAQPASETCVTCGVRAARYYCVICKLWDDDPNKSIYHCVDCGICRVGRGLGKDFIHCKTCGVCVSIANENSHKCIERASDCDCPICGEYLFSSLQSVVFMKCGHSIHRKCHDALMKTSYKCPICSQSVVNMEIQFRALDRAIESQPMPPQFQDTKAIVSCNDCYAKSLVKYHWLGLKCAICDSFNTAQLQILSDAEVEDPAEATTIEESHPEQVASNHLSAEPWTLSPTNAGPARSRRHSVHLRFAASQDEPDSIRFSPYHIPPRIGRSVSPFRTSFLSHEPMVAEPTEHAGESDEEEDNLEFWGGDAPRSPKPADEALEGDDESDDESLLSIEEVDDDGDDEDHMEFPGHR